MKRKLFVLLPDGRGGAERQTVQIVSCLPAQEYEVTYIVVGKAADLVIGLIPDNANWRLLRINRIWQGGTVRIWWLFMREKPDLVFSSFHYLNSRMILAAILAGVRRTVIRGNYSLNDGDLLSRFLMPFLYKKASAVICQTDELREEAISRLHLLPERVFALYNMFDSNRIDSLNAEAPNPYGEGMHLVNVARICPEKAQDVLLKAFSAFRRNHPEAVLHILSAAVEYDYYNSLLHYIAENNLEKNVVLEGYKANPFPWIKHAALFLLPSRREGFPNALIEAQYLGVPAVVSDCIQSMDKIVQNGVNGYIVPFGNVEALADAMESAISLRNIPFTYRSASKADFVQVFHSLDS